MIHRELVPGKLQIVRRLGAGGMGVVYEAIHLGLDRRVAVKVIHPQSSDSVEARARFFREARALALLQSEHIVQVLDVDTLPEGDPYMVMEYLEGRDLKRELVKRGPLLVTEAVGYLIQTCAGVATAHAAGIVHRDLKPANIFITNLDGARRVKILDFGVAKFSTAPEQTLTSPTRLVGTPLYMSPEQVLGNEANVRSDIWALGVALFQLLTGRSPFRSPGAGGTVVDAILNGAAAALHEVRQDVPLGLSQVVARCLERVEADRFEDARALSAALAPFGPREPVVRFSVRAPRGSSAPPPVARANDHLMQARELEAPKLTAQESATVTHQPPDPTVTPVAHVAREPATALAAHVTNSLSTLVLTARLLPARSASSPVVASTSPVFAVPAKAHWAQLAKPIFALLILGLAIVVGRSLRAPTAAVSATHPDSARENPQTPIALAESLESIRASANQRPLPVAPLVQSDAPSRTESARPSPSNAAFAASSTRAPVPATAAKPRPVVQPALPPEKTEVPLHL